MIHFFPTFSDDASASPFAMALKKQGVPFALFSCKISLRYRNRMWLILIGWPRICLFALRSAYRSMIKSGTYPDVVVLGSHIEVIVFSVVRLFLLKKNPKIVLLGFIYTKRKSWLKNSAKKLYLGFIFRFVEKVICHSALEVEEYKRIFHRTCSIFVYIPYGIHVDGCENYSAPNNHTSIDSKPYILTAGRSGRDYSTLVESIRNLPINLHLVCDSDLPLKKIEMPSNVTIFRSCYDDEYIDQIRHALIVALPLADSDISAGQMVLLQAMSFGKPVVITRTPTVIHYVKPGLDVLLVEKGSVCAWRETLEKLINDFQLRNKLGQNARRSYEENFSMEAYVGNLIEQIGELL